MSRLFNAASGVFFAGAAAVCSLETWFIAHQTFPVPFIDKPVVAVSLGLLTAFAAVGSAVYAGRDLRNAMVLKP